MAKALVVSEGISGGQNTTFGFAFNMEKVFECYVRKLFQEFEDWKEEPHEGRIWLCSEERYIDKTEGLSLVEPNGKRVLLKPDIVYQKKQDGKFKIIVDCKWKFWGWNKTNEAQSQNISKRRGKIESKDIRQLFIYQMAYKKRKVLDSKLFLIYPSSENDDNQINLSKFVVGNDTSYSLWAFSFLVFKFNDITGYEFDDNEERYWNEIKNKLKAIDINQGLTVVAKIKNKLEAISML